MTKFQKSKGLKSRQHIIRELRKRVCIPGKQETRLSKLSDEELYKLYVMLCNGESAKAAARYLQQVCGVSPKSSVHSISQGILKFRKRISHLLTQGPPPESSDLIQVDDVGKIGQLDELESLERVHQNQLERILRLMEEERETNLKYTGMSREIQAITALTKALTKAREWAMMNEGNDPLRRRKLERMRRRFTTLFNDTISEGGERLLAATKRFLELAEEHAFEVEVGPDGKLHLVKPDEFPNDNHTQ